jgi:uncharacterized membrane protein YedE/YeeE
VHMIGLRLFRARNPLVLGASEGAPWIDGRLVAGAAIFGVGWGLAGYCPGPAIVALGFGAVPAWGFVAAMIVGVLAGEAAARWRVSASEASRGVSAC